MYSLISLLSTRLFYQCFVWHHIVLFCSVAVVVLVCMVLIIFLDLNFIIRNQNVLEFGLV